MNGIQWRWLRFDDFTGPELYAVLQLRSAVFVVEQHCVFQDMDNADAQALHLLGLQEGRLVAYARCFAAGGPFAEASIGRVLTHTSLRGRGAGHLLIEKAIVYLTQQWGPQAIRIGAQRHLQAFYQRHGFEKAGLLYLEDGIEHIEMLRRIESI